MKRVIYNTCVADPWIKVAQNLQTKYNFEPVYWIGYNYDNSETLVKEAFPDICYQSYPDAWKGIFSAEIRKKSYDCFVDVDLINRLAKYELLAIKMMDRLDYDRYSFNFMERERHYINLIKNWMACFDIYKPDMVISAVNPHRVYDYVLYLLCKDRNIPFINFQYSMCVERIYALTDIYSIGDIFDSSYKKYLQQPLTKEMLPPEILFSFEKVQKDYSEAIPTYMKDHEIKSKKSSKRFNMVRAFFNKYKLFGKDGLIRKGTLSVTMLKNKNYSLEETRGSLSYLYKIRRGKQKYNDSLRTLYSSLVSVPDKNHKYIFFPLHYQPEATTSPAGDVFVNQRYCIETLLKNTPDDCFIYVKEHPQQFMAHMLGQTSRIKEFYTDIIANKRVKLMPLELDSYSIMKDSLAVATVTGTVGWEALMNKKPVIVFGLIWYEKMAGVLRITDSASASDLYGFIKNYKYDEKKVLAYLMAFADNSIKAYHYQGRKEKVNMPEDECIRNISEIIYKLTRIN